MGFLDHLGGIAVGTPPAGAAQPALPSRFAPQSAPIAQEQEEVSDDSAPRRDGPTRSRSVAAAEAVRGLDAGGSTVAVAVGDGPSDASAAREPTQSSAPKAGGEPQPATTSSATVAAPSFQQERRPISPADRIAMAAPEPTDIQPAQGPARSVAVAPAQPPAPSPDRRAPLSEPIVAGRTVRQSQERPIVHVTIDRIDVRAGPPSAAPPPPPRKRPQPAVSLADYLRESDGGRA